MTTVSLYSYWRSSCAWRVRIALNMKQIPFEYIPVHLVKREQSDPDFMTINPSAQVPVLKADGIQISESVAIMEYLEETRPETPLLPKAPSDRATVRRIVEMINAGIQPKQNLAVLNFLLNEGYCDDAKRMKFAAHWNEVGLRAVEKVLEECSGKFCVGDEVTFADCCLVPGYYSAKRFKVDVDQFPVICKIVGELEKLSAVLQAHPSQQPDAE